MYDGRVSGYGFVEWYEGASDTEATKRSVRLVSCQVVELWHRAPVWCISIAVIPGGYKESQLLLPTHHKKEQQSE